MGKQDRVQTKSQRPPRSPADLLSPLPQPMLMALAAFSNYVAALEVDYLIFMARKAVRLHDLLIASGYAAPKATVITDHVLDQSLVKLAGKRVAIIDDTLILGTTIAEAERKLRAAGVTQIIKVLFAVDSDNWCRPLANIDRYFVSLTATEMLNFCASEVEALSQAAIPYLTDFPVSKKIKIGRAHLSTLYSLPGWDTFAITSKKQESLGVYYYTHIPTPEDIDNLAGIVGNFGNIIEIIKVRSFVFSTDREQIARIIPIITLKPLSEESVDLLFTPLIENLGFSASGRENLRLHLTSTRSKLRFLQYFLSLVIGEKFFALLREGLGLTQPIRFDREEAIRLFGPWLLSELDVLHASAAMSVAEGRLLGMAPDPIPVDNVPPDIRELVKEDIDKFLGFKDSYQVGDEPRNLFSDLVRVFVELHKKYEIPAREEAHRLGLAVLDVGRDEAPWRDRLKIGFSWSGLVEHLCEREKMRSRTSRSLLLSLMLDALVDLGIAVPILCLREGIVFRAYRHGEDVLFSEREHGLAYAVAEGFIDGNGRTAIPKQTMEKLLVSLLRVGVANDFLEAFWGMDGSQRVARIAFHRHGAVATYTDEPSLYADSQDSWLSRHLVQSRVFKRTADRHYALGKCPDASTLSGKSLVESRHLGFLIGSVSRQPGTDIKPIMDENDLSVLATCTLPRDAAGAVLAELRIFDKWFEEEFNNLLSTDFTSEKACSAALVALPRSNGYAAFNSAYFKLRGYWERRAIAVINRCGEHFAMEGKAGRFLSEHWHGLWAPVLAADTSDQRAVFDQENRKLGGEFLTIAIGMLTMELALASRVGFATRPHRTRYRNICDKAASYLEAITPYADKYHSQGKALARLREVCTLREPMPDPLAAYRYGHTYIAERRAAARSLALGVNETVRTYGRSRERTDFQFALWYDIIDSLGEKSGLSGSEMADYRGRVRAFKTGANTALLGMKRDAQRANTAVSVVPRSLDSTDDEKDILFARRGAAHWMRETIRMLLEIGERHNIIMRMLVLNADFAGRPPFCHRADPNIEGAVFWEHGSRVKKWVRAEEQALLSNGQSKHRNSLLWLGDEIVDAISEFDFVNWIGERRCGTAEATIDDRHIRTRLTGGLVAI